MGHDHHRCECKHERVKYCPKCRVCHCLDCKQEWREYPTWTYTTGTYLGGQTVASGTMNTSLSGSAVAASCVHPS